VLRDFESDVPMTAGILGWGMVLDLNAASPCLSKSSDPAWCFWLGACETRARLRIDLSGRPALRSRREDLQIRQGGAALKSHLAHSRIPPVTFSVANPCSVHR